MTPGLTDAEYTEQSKEFGERADVVLVERVVRLKIRHFTLAIAGVTQQRSGPGCRWLGAMAGGTAHRTRLIRQGAQSLVVQLGVPMRVTRPEGKLQPFCKRGGPVIVEPPAVVRMTEVAGWDDVGRDRFAVLPERMPPPDVVAEISALVRTGRVSKDVHAH